MRAVAAWKAGLLSFTGAALAVPTGFVPVAFVFVAAVRPGEQARLAFPWSTAAELVLAAPLLATLVALTTLSFVPDVLADAHVSTRLTLALTHVVAAAIVIPALASRLGDPAIQPVAIISHHPSPAPPARPKGIRHDAIPPRRS